MSRGPHAYLSPDDRAVRTAARRRLAGAVRRGELRRGPCNVCGIEPTHGHHANGYDRPLDVEWLCARHHGLAHLEDQQTRFAAAYDAALRARKPAPIG